MFITDAEPADVFEEDDHMYYNCPHCDEKTELFLIGADKGNPSYKTNTRKVARV
ncbi:MAG: hypothetical protein ACXW1P_03430 [Methylophilaceae bacterium]